MTKAASYIHNRSSIVVDLLTVSTYTAIVGCKTSQLSVKCRQRRWSVVNRSATTEVLFGIQDAAKMIDAVSECVSNFQQRRREWNLACVGFWVWQTGGEMWGDRWTNCVQTARRPHVAIRWRHLTIIHRHSLPFITINILVMPFIIGYTSNNPTFSFFLF